MNHHQVALAIIEALGEGNLVAAAHCATRLRLVLKDSSLVDQAALDDNPAIKGTFETNGQYQIIIGPGDVNKVYEELLKLTKVEGTSTETLKEVASNGKKQNPVMALVKVLSDIFVPLIPALVAGGLLMAINNVLTSPDLFGPLSVVEMFPAIKDFAGIINLLASAPFAFLPILVGFSATKRFGGNGYLGAAMAMAMVMPDLVNGYGVANALAEGTMPYWNIFGLQVAQAGYQGSVLPVLAVAFILANLEKFFHKRIPQVFDFTFTPMLAIIITGLLTFTIVGPFMRMVSDGLTDSLVWLYQTTGAIGLGVFGTFYSAIVITGLHQSFPAIETTLLAEVAKTGGSFIFPIASMANIAQGAATLAVFLISKNEKEKSLASSASISALLGITEPAIFGINLKLKYPFICAMIASGIASIFIGLFHVLAVSMGPASVIGFISIAAPSVKGFLISGTISFVLAFTLTYFYGKKQQANIEGEKERVGKETRIDADTQQTRIGAPVSGQTLALKNVNDPVFFSEMMGKGIGIQPETDEVYAPADGTLAVVYETKHAYGLQTETGVEVLIHIGIDTVNLAGEHFTTNKKSGDKIKKGELLGTFDRKAIQAAGYDATVILVVTNTNDFAEVQPKEADAVTAGETVLSIRA
ncbi:sucrose-specific PTS transporter subunit IIBC [Enterococcus sp. LJL98]